MAQWDILVFRKSDERYTQTISGIRLPLHDAQRIFSIADNNPMYDSYPIGPTEADQLEKSYKTTFNFEDYDYFFERQS